LESVLIDWREQQTAGIRKKRPDIDEKELGPEHLSNLEMGYIYDELLH